jgi:cephalosporin-C deacetylase
MTLGGLLRVGAPVGPGDFADFWRGRSAAARGVPVRVSSRRVESEIPGREVSEVEFDAWGEWRIGGWFTRPAGRVVGKAGRCGFVVSHGYGGRSGPDVRLPVEDAAAVFPCARGIGRSRRAGVSEEPLRHVLNGIASRDEYILGGCAADIWAAATALRELAPEVERVYYIGSSFGGGVGALALAWDERFVRAYLDVPSFGNHPLRVQLRCTGSGEAVRAYHRRHPEVMAVLKYFDAATAARHLRIPVMVSAALFDPAVPPPGQFAVYNGLAGEKRLFVKQAGHFDHPGAVDEAERLWRELVEWFSSET